MPHYDIESTDRLSKPSISQRDENTPFHKLYVNLFYRDVQATLPYQSHSNSKYRINVSPNDQEGFNFLANLFRTPNIPLDIPASNHHFNHSIEEFIRGTAANLAYFGQVHWEIVTLKVQFDHKTSSVTWLARIPGEVTKKGDNYRQLIPRNENSLGVYVDIPSSKVWSMEIPERFGGPNNQKRLIEELAGLSDIMPQFMSENISRGNLNQSFDIKRYSHARFGQMAKLMQPWGWMLNQWQEDKTTEYYWIYRRLRFYSSLSFFREFILSRMNELLKRLNMRYQINIQGLPGEAEINSYIDGIKQGKISFNEALNFIYQI